MAPSVRTFTLILLAALVFQGCAPQMYQIHERDLHLASSSQTPVGAIGANCRQTAIRLDRVNIDDVSASSNEGYVIVHEKTSRAAAFSFGLSTLLAGVGLSSVGTLLVMQHDHGDPDQLFFGPATPTVGAVALGTGLALAAVGIAVGTRGAKRGAEVPRQWEPSMTYSAPCVDDQRGAAIDRARGRSRTHSHQNTGADLEHPAQHWPQLLHPTEAPWGMSAPTSVDAPPPEVP